MELTNAVWSAERANLWWAKLPWLVGCNYVTSDAVNDVQMWQKETFHPQLIRKELAIARSIGMNSVRVFLSYTVWAQEQQAFLDTFEEFLSIADECGMLVMPILFDDCAFDGIDPVYGPQPEPTPGVHNSRWVPSPGFRIQDDPAKQASLREYVHALVGAHREDKRIVVWDLFNEPGNSDRVTSCLPLLVNAFRWAREVAPTQPLTACVWDFSERADGINQVLLALSDVNSIHLYLDGKQTREKVSQLQLLRKPILITEWLHRPNGNTIPDLLPWMKEQKIGAWQWGMIQGKTQTNLNWNTMGPSGTPDPNPELWQHDILHPDGSPYREEEIALYKSLAE